MVLFKLDPFAASRLRTSAGSLPKLKVWILTLSSRAQDKFFRDDDPYLLILILCEWYKLTNFSFSLKNTLAVGMTYDITKI